AVLPLDLRDLKQPRVVGTLLRAKVFLERREAQKLALRVFELGGQSDIRGIVGALIRLDAGLSVTLLGLTGFAAGRVPDLNLERGNLTLQASDVRVVGAVLRRTRRVLRL